MGCCNGAASLDPPRILVLCEYASLNGGEHSLLSTLPSVVAAGLQPLVALPPVGPLNERLRSFQIERVPFSRYDAAGKSVSLADARQRLAELLRKTRPRLLHANSLAMGRLSGPIASELNVPSVAHLRDILTLSAAAIADLNRHRRLLAVSQATRAFHVAAGLNADKTTVLYNGVDLQRFHPARPTGDLHRELQLPIETPLVASVGQLGLRKDPLTFLHAAALVAEQHSTAHFLLIGQRHSDKQESRELEASLHALAQRPPLAGRVRFLGVRDDIENLLPELTLLAHAARQEPLGRVLLEAAAVGLAIVASDVGGTAEIFPPEAGAASLFPAGEVANLSGQMLTLLNDARRRQTLGHNARMRAEAMFDIRHRAAELVDVYGEILRDS